MYSIDNVEKQFKNDVYLPSQRGHLIPKVEFQSVTEDGIKHYAVFVTIAGPLINGVPHKKLQDAMRGVGYALNGMSGGLPNQLYWGSRDEKEIISFLQQWNRGKINLF
jgi:hypothetical protein